MNILNTRHQTGTKNVRTDATLAFSGFKMQNALARPRLGSIDCADYGKRAGSTAAFERP